MDLRVHNPYIMSKILIPGLVSTGPVGGQFLNEGPHEIMHYHEFQVGLIELVDMVDNLLYHQLSMDLSLGRTPVHQDLRIKVASLHPVLFSRASRVL